jgi:hypothetical protein
LRRVTRTAFWRIEARERSVDAADRYAGEQAVNPSSRRVTTTLHDLIDALEDDAVDEKLSARLILAVLQRSRARFVNAVDPAELLGLATRNPTLNARGRTLQDSAKRNPVKGERE